MSIVETPGAAAPLDPSTAKWIGYSLAVAGAIFPLPILIVSQPIGMALALVSILCQLMLLGLIYASPEAFLVNPPRLNGRMINYGLIIPVVCLTIAAAAVQFVDFRVLLVAALVLALAGFVSVLLAPRANPVPGPIFYAVFVAAFAGGLGWGALALADWAFDPSEGQPYETQVLFKYVTYGRNTGYHVTLAPWGPVARPTDVGISRAQYDQVSSGGPMCVRLHPGALYMAWYRVKAC